MKDIGKIINSSYLVMEQKQFKDAKKFLYNTETAKKIISALKSKEFTNSGFDYKTCEDILDFMIGQFGYLESRMEEPLFMKENLNYFIGLEASIGYILNNMSFEHGKHFASENFIDNLNGKLLKTNFDKEKLQEFNNRYDKFIEPLYDEKYYENYSL